MRVLLLFTMISCSPPVTVVQQSVESVAIWDDNNSLIESEWAEVVSTAHVFVGKAVIDNGIARVTHMVDIAPTQYGFHQLWFDQGGGWVNATSPNHGDYTYWSQSVSSPPYSVQVLTLDPPAVEYRFDFAGAYEQIDLTKTVSMRDGEPGMFVEFHSLPVNPNHEREWGSGSGSTLSFSRHALVHHPIHGRHGSLNAKVDVAGPTWTASVRVGMITVVVTKRPMYSMAMQFAPTQNGIHTVNRFDEQPGDGVQGYMEGIPYAEGIVLEGWSGQYTEITDTLATGGTYQRAEAPLTRSVSVAAGVYDVWFRYRAPRASTVDFTWPCGSVRFATISSSSEFLTQKIAQVTLDGGVSLFTVHPQEDKMHFDAMYLVPSGLMESVVDRVAPVFE